MRRINYFTRQFFQFSLLFVTLVMTGCSKHQEKALQNPVLNFTGADTGLDVTIKGTAGDPDGKITQVTIEWGDNTTNNLAETDFADFEVTHTYPGPSVYRIKATATDNDGLTATDSLSVIVDYKETSLEGIKPAMFKVSDKEYLVLTINLHTYQETRQNEKLNMITDLIGKMDVDFIAFQECAQNKAVAIFTGIIREDNMALVISQRIKEKYHIEYNFAWNWSHYGWNVWEEGVAVLSKHPVVQSDDRYISSETGTGSITSRKVIYASCLTQAGLFNIFSAHTHWRTSAADEEQNNQIKNIRLMVTEKESTAPGCVSFVCGDFNGNPTSDYPWSEGYNTMMKGGVYSDTFLEIYPDANLKPAQSMYNTIGGDFPGRIDYIFMKKDGRYRIASSQIIFTTDVVGEVSDHFGVLTKVGLVQ